MLILCLETFNTGQEKMITAFEKTVPFYDVDPMRVMWHGNYVKYMEEARCAFLAERDMTYNDMEKYGYAFPVVELKVKYIRPCVFGQRLIIKTRLDACDSFLVFKYEFVDAKTGEKLCKAQTKQMCVCLKTKESLFEIPERIRKQLGGK